MPEAFYLLPAMATGTPGPRLASSVPDSRPRLSRTVRYPSPLADRLPCVQRLFTLSALLLTVAVPLCQAPGAWPDAACQRPDQARARLTALCPAWRAARLCGEDDGLVV